jgi:hypothetical protein
VPWGAGGLLSESIIRALCGREQTKKEFAQLLHASYFSIANVHSAGRLKVIEATIV